MAASDRLIEEAKQRIAALAAVDADLKDGFNAAELAAIAEFAEPLAVHAAKPAQFFRSYVECKESVRKDRLVLLAAVPALASVAALANKKLLMLVAEEAQAMRWRAAARHWLGNYDLEIATWAQSARRLGGFGSQHGTYWFLGDMDTSQEPGTVIANSLGNPMAAAIEKMIQNRSANFLLLHQIGRLAVQPDV